MAEGRYGQSLAYPEITGETADLMAEKVKEAITIGREAGYGGGSIGDLIHGVAFLHAWDDEGGE